MYRLLSKLRCLMPGSMAARGLVLVLIVGAALALPGLVAHRVLTRARESQFGASQEALLAIALKAHLESSGDLAPNYGAWLNELATDSRRVCWAGALDEQGGVVEFLRRTSLRREDIVAQIRADTSAPDLRPLIVRARPSGHLFVLTLPKSGRQRTLAAIIDLGGASAADTRRTMIALAGLAAAGLILSIAWLWLAIHRPLRQLNRWVVEVHRGLSEAAVGHLAPEELQNLARAVEQTQLELRKWRAQAGKLRFSLEAEVDARTKSLTRNLNAVAQQADTDPLTKLLNRRPLLRDLPQLFQQYADAGRELAAVMLDVDHFKVLNDALGHQAGDEILAFLGDLIRATLRKRSDLAVRYGGDEFVLMLPDTSAAEAAVLGRRLRELFAQRARTFRGAPRPPALSVGIAARAEHHAATWQELLELADAAMYYAKRRGVGVATVNDLRVARR